MELRDKKVMEFIATYKLANKEQIKKVFFPNTHANVPMRRLKKLAEDGYVNRVKLDGNKWIYYSDKKPSKRLLEHDLKITDLVAMMILNGYEIIDFRKSLVIDNIICDAYIKYRDFDGYVKHFVLEVQLSNSIRDCVEKYKNFKSTILNSNVRLESVPSILVVTDLKQKVKLSGYKVMYLNTNFDNIKEVL